MRRWLFASVLDVALMMPAIAASPPPGALVAASPPPGSPAWAEQADVVEHAGAQLPLDSTFVTSVGQPVRLREFFDGVHPVLLVLAYYECQQLCSVVLDGAVTAMAKLERSGFRLGPQYHVLTVSFDATERIDQAARKQASVVAKLGQNPRQWPFLVGSEASVRAVVERLGFQFVRDRRTGQIAHPAVAFVLTPHGRISRYLYGTDYSMRDLKLALLEASDGKTGSFGDKILLRCFHYDASMRRYGLFISRFMKIGGLVILIIAIVIGRAMWRVERRRARAELA